MTYKILTIKKFEKDFEKLDKSTQKIIKHWIDRNLVGTENPRYHGKSLSENLSSLWKYHIGDYRLLCEIKDNELLLVMITIGHTSDIYEG